MRLAWWWVVVLTPAAAEPLWQIGTVDRNTAELAHGPADYRACARDAFYLVGRSEAARDWPYAQPGPVDDWAGSRGHTWTIAFALQAVPATGEAILRLDLADTHSRFPPRLRIAVNDHVTDLDLPGGAGDESVFGEPGRGRPHRVELPVPAGRLVAGLNRVSLSTLSGSWLLYDAVSFDAPAGTVLGEPRGTLLTAVESPALLVRRDGALKQLVRATVQHLDAPAAGWLAVGQVSRKIELATGQQTLELALPPVAEPTDTTVRVRCGGELLTLPVTLRPVRRWTVWVLPHSHVDIGYTHLQSEVEANQWRFIDEAIDLAAATAGNPEGARFKWNVEVLWAVDSYLKRATPAQRKRFGDAVRKGWIGLDAMYANLLTGLCSPEELLRIFRLATKLREEFGVPLDSAMISDVPGYTWGLVPAMQQAGVRYFSPGTNGGDRIGFMLATWGDKPFWWIGPSGREKVLTWFPGRGYWGRAPLGDELLARLNALEASGYRYDMLQLRHCLGDNAGPDAGLAEQVRRWNETIAYPHVRIATTHEMFAAFEAKWGASLPRYAGDLTGYWEDGAASSARETALARNAADRLTQAEALYAMRDRRAYPAAEFEAAWRNVMLFNEHTWGAHNSISEPDSEFAKGQWAIKRQFALDAEAQSKELLRRALGEPAEVVGPVEAVEVIRTSPAEPGRDRDVVRIPAGWAPEPCRVIGPRGEEVPSQRLTTGEVAFCDSALWRLDSRRYRLERAEPLADGLARATATSLSNRIWQVQVDAVTGEIASLSNLLGGECVDQAAGLGLNAFRYVRGRDPRVAEGNGPVRITVVEPGPVVAKLRIESEAPGCRSLSRELELASDTNYLSITNTIDKLPVRDKEAVRFGFPFARGPGSRVSFETGWAVVEPQRQQLRGANRNQLSTSHWLLLQNAPGPSIGLIALDAPLVEFGDPRPDGAWTDRLERSTHVWSLVMNNYWHTNYCADQEGPVTFRYRIEMCWDPDKVDADATRHPLVVVPALEAGPLAEEVGGLHWINAALSVKPTDDGAGWIVRLVEPSDPAHWPLRRYRIWLSDLSERRGEPVTASTRLPRTTILTLRVEPRA